MTSEDFEQTTHRLDQLVYGCGRRAEPDGRTDLLHSAVPVSGRLEQLVQPSPSAEPCRLEDSLAHGKEAHALARWRATQCDRVRVVAERYDDLLGQARLPDTGLADDGDANDRTGTDRAAERRPQLR
jgi:hypothetical protein